MIVGKYYKYRVSFSFSFYDCPGVPHAVMLYRTGYSVTVRYLLVDVQTA